MNVIEIILIVLELKIKNVLFENKNKSYEN